ncbi:MAG: hypothetical protein GY847_26460 [Proteobacteria bacterium]|nr:hypothetical protein [Pseudomonadota bacterium]
MDISFFRRGITLPRNTSFGPVQEIDTPSHVALLLKQEAGPPCLPIVEVGETVALGQKVAEGTSGSADLHASISGLVKAIEEFRLPDGFRCNAIIIEENKNNIKDAKTDTGEASNLESRGTALDFPLEKGGRGISSPKHISEKDKIPPAPFVKGGEPILQTDQTNNDPSKCTPKELLERIRRAGIVRGGHEVKSLATIILEAMSPTNHVAVTESKNTKSIKWLAVRFCDEDPHLETLEAFTAGLDKNTADLNLGVQTLIRITGAEKVCFVLGKKQSAPYLKKLAKECDFRVLRLDESNYPSLADSLVTRAVSGIERLHKSGILIVNIDTVIDVCRAVRDRQPVIDKTLTVRGPNGIRVLKTRIGTRLSDIASAAGQSGKIGKAVLGGPMRGCAHHTLDFPLTKGIDGLTLFSPDEVTLAVNAQCFGCGLCAEVCPTRLTPGMLSRYCEFGQFLAADKAHLFSCIECGCCAYVCPAGRSMVQFMIQGKREVLAARRGGNNA